MDFCSCRINFSGWQFEQGEMFDLQGRD